MANRTLSKLVCLLAPFALIGCHHVSTHALVDYRPDPLFEPAIARTPEDELRSAGARGMVVSDTVCPTLGRRVRWVREHFSVNVSREVAFDATTGELLFVSEEFVPDVACLCFFPPGETDDYGIAPRCVKPEAPNTP